MGSPLGPTLANIFLWHHEIKCLKNWPKAFKPVHYKNVLMTFLYCLTNQNEFYLLLIIWTKTKKQLFPWNWKKYLFLFLMLRYVEKMTKFITNAFRKDTFSGVYTNFSSFVALEYKFAIVYTRLCRCFAIVCNFSKFHFEFETLKHLAKMLTQRNFLTSACRSF